MHILTTSTENQDIIIKPRKTYAFGGAILTLTDKATRVSRNYSNAYNYNATTNTMTLTASFDDLKAETYYTFVVSDVRSEIYRGMVYVTNQTDYPKYEVGKNDYTLEDSYDNEFVFID